MPSRQQCATAVFGKRDRAKVSGKTLCILVALATAELLVIARKPLTCS
jgi:hypothetical protein